MDKLTEYPKLLKRILAEYIELCSRRPNPELETFVIEDEHKGHYIRHQFLEALNRFNVSPFQVTPEELAEELACE